MNLDHCRVIRYARTVDPDFLESLNKQKPKTMSKLSDIWYDGVIGGRNMHYNNSRYIMLNYKSTFTTVTIEFRLLDFDNNTEDRKGGLHAGQLK